MCKVPFGAIQALLHGDSPSLLPPSPSQLPPTQTHSPGAFRGLGSLLAMLVSSAPVLHLGYILCMFTSHWLAQPNKSSPVPAWDITRPLLSSAKAKCEVLRLEGIFSCGTRDAVTQRLPGESDSAGRNKRWMCWELLLGGSPGHVSFCGWVWPCLGQPRAHSVQYCWSPKSPGGW